MIRTTTILKTFLLFLFLAVQQIVDASDIRGAEIQWKHLSGQQYEISLNYYRDCRGLAADDSKLLKIFCGRGVVADTLFVHAQRSSFRDITPACLTNTEPCGSVGNTDSAGAGTEKHIYKATVDFGAGLLDTMRSNGCCTFRFYFEECCRSTSMTTGGANTPFVIDAEIDLCNLQNSLNPRGDNSPQFRNEPVVDWCCNQPIRFNDGMVDIDGDSLVFSLVAALKSTDSAITYSAPYNPATWAMRGHCRINSLCACRDRFPLIDGFCFDPETADYKFHAINCGESGVLVLKVEQFRLDTLAQKWLYIGYTKREVNLRISESDDCEINNPPIIKDVQNPTICEGQEICMTIVAEDEEFAGSIGVQSWKDTIDFTWNEGLPNARFEVDTPYFTFKNGITTAMREVEICWQTQEGDGREAPYFFAVTARDRACPNNAVTSRAFAVKVKRRPKFEKNITVGVCGKYSVSFVPADTLFYKGTLQYNWSVKDSLGNMLFSSQKQNDSVSLPQGIYYVHYTANNPPVNCPVSGIDTLYLTPDDSNWDILHPKIFIKSEIEQCLRGNFFSFKDTSTADTGFITEYFWDFGDGDTAFGKTVNKTYDSAGVYTVRLQIISNLGCVSQTEKEVRVFEMPQSRFAVSDTVICFKNNRFDFFDSSISTVSALQRTWRFGDGDSSFAVNPSKSYSLSGSFEVSLEVTDSNHCADTSYARVEVLSQALAKIEALSQNPLCQQSLYDFKNISPIEGAGTMAEQYWEFSNGLFDTADSVSVSFNSVGQHFAKLIVGTGNGCLDTAVHNFYINPKPQASAHVSDTAQCANAVFLFNDNSTIQSGNIISRKWSFEDGDISLISNPEKAFVKEGIYNVELVVISDLNLQGIEEYIIQRKVKYAMIYLHQATN